MIKLIDFYSTTCGPCRMLMKSLEKVKLDFPDVVVEKCDENSPKELYEKYNVHEVPTLIIEKDGIEIQRITRAVPPQEIVKYF